jgi:hypothetical protein
VGAIFPTVDKISLLDADNVSSDQTTIQTTVPGKKYSEITFPILSSDTATKKDAHFLKYPIYVGGSRGRGQIYPDGSKSNNMVSNAIIAGIISKII